MARWCVRKGLSPGATLPVSQCWELAKRWYEERAEADWIRASPQKLRMLFREVGLRGTFWDSG